MKCRDAAIGWAGNVKLVTLDFVIRLNRLQKLGKDAGSLFEKQIVVRSGGSHDDVSPFLSFRSEVAIQDVVDRVHCLRSATEGEDRRICFCRIITVWKDHLIMDRGSAYLLCLLDEFRL